MVAHATEDDLIASSIECILFGDFILPIIDKSN